VQLFSGTAEGPGFGQGQPVGQVLEVHVFILRMIYFFNLNMKISIKFNNF
jgi:hypothetical protein